MTRARGGFTLIEVIIAVVMLSIVAFGLMKFTGQHLSGTGRNATRHAAQTVAETQLSLVRADPVYQNLSTRWAGTVTGFPGYPSMVRRTTISRVQRTAVPAADYTRVTVSVSDPAMATPVTLSTVVKAP